MTGLDPAGPKFTNEEKDFRLDESDASYVDVIHTNAGVLGTSQRVGDIDFYPNGGKHQPGCLVNGRLKKRIFKILHELFPRCSNYLSFILKRLFKWHFLVMQINRIYFTRKFLLLHFLE